MSLQAMVMAIKAHGLTPTEKLVLICLANYANEDGEAWPRQTTIAEQCGMSRSTVLRNYKTLEDKGVIASIARKNEKGADIAKMVTLFPQGGVTQEHRGCSTVTQGGVAQERTLLIDKPINSNQLKEPQAEILIEEKDKEESPKSTLSKTKKPPVKPDTHGAVWPGDDSVRRAVVNYGGEALAKNYLDPATPSPCGKFIFCRTKYAVDQLKRIRSLDAFTIVTQPTPVDISGKRFYAHLTPRGLT